MSFREGVASSKIEKTALLLTSKKRSGRDDLSGGAGGCIDWQQGFLQSYLHFFIAKVQRTHVHLYFTSNRMSKKNQKTAQVGRKIERLSENKQWQMHE